jgi:MscS family membrane protein
MTRRIIPGWLMLLIILWGLSLAVDSASAQIPLPLDVETDSKQPDDPPSDPLPQSTGSGSMLDNIDFRGLFEQNAINSWLILLGAIFVSLGLGKLVEAVLGNLGGRFEARGQSARAHVFSDLIGPGKLALLGIGLAVGLADIEMTKPLQTFTVKTLVLIYSIAVFWYAFNLVSVVEVVLKRLTSMTESPLDDQLVPLIRKTLRVFLVVISVLFVADTVFGQDIGAWLAGLGIAGLAVSLAAQDSLKNLFGSLTILLDRPFQIGERIVFAGYDGIIEEIGFRSTKLRTLTGHVVTIPNSNIVNDPVENIGRRPYIRRTMNVTITYDTPRDKIDRAVGIIRDILNEKDLREPIHPVIDGNELPPRVFFNDFNAESLNIFVIYWFAPPAYWDYMAHAERINFRLFEEFEKAGIEFAFPTQTLYLAGDPKRQLAVKMLSDGLEQS